MELFFLKKIKNIFTRQDGILALLLVFILFKGIVWGWNIPLFTLSDEVTHFTYIHYLSEYKELPRSADTPTKLEKSSAELRKNLKSLQVYKTPLSLEHTDFAASADANPVSFNDFLNNANLRANWSFNYPPLYYVLMSIFYTLGKNLNFDIISIAYLIRFCAIFFLIITIIFSYKIAFILTNDRLFALIICSIISLMASMSAVFSSINNDVALIAFSHIVLYLVYRIFYSSSQNVNRLIILASFAFLAAILSKPQAIIFIPLMIGALIYNWLKNKKIRTNAAMNILVIGSIILVTILIMPNGFLSNFFKIDFRSIDGGGGIMTILKNDLLRRFTLMFDFFIQIGLFHSDQSVWIFSSLSVLILFSTMGIILFCYNFFKKRDFYSANVKALLLCAIPIITLEILYTFLYFREAIINKAYDFPGQGRYYFIVLTPLLVIFVYGLQYLFELLRLPRRALYFILIIFFAFLNSYFFINIILPSAYL